MDSEPGSYFLIAHLNFIALTTTGTSLWVSFFLVLLLLGCSALISGSEVAYFSLTRNDIEGLHQNTQASSSRILTLVNRPRYLLATILIANNFINIAITILSVFLLEQVLPESLLQAWADGILKLFGFLKTYFGISIDAIAYFFRIAIETVLVTFFLVLFGEVAPKVYAKTHSLRLASFMSNPLIFLKKIVYPLSSVLVKSTQIIEHRLEKQTKNSSAYYDIDQAIELTVSHEKDSASEVDILKSIVKFNHTSVKQIMRARVDVIALDFRGSFKEIIKEIKSSGYSRYPVYDEDFDNIMGILYTKDLLNHMDEDNSFEWQELIRTNVLYVVESKKINDLLEEIQIKKMHLCIVVDEYGGSSGIVTLEDVMEEVIGEIKDEFDADAALEYRQLDKFNYLFEGKTMINDLCRVVGVDTATFDDKRGESDSVAGLLLEVCGYIPKKDQEIKINQYAFKIMSVNKRRIEKIKITLPRK